jgi:hypothetical protein
MESIVGLAAAAMHSPSRALARNWEIEGTEWPTARYEITEIRYERCSDTVFDVRR